MYKYFKLLTTFTKFLNCKLHKFWTFVAKRKGKQKTLIIAERAIWWHESDLPEDIIPVAIIDQGK
jgi:hypothetical protein